MRKLLLSVALIAVMSTSVMAQGQDRREYQFRGPARTNGNASPQQAYHAPQQAYRGPQQAFQAPQQAFRGPPQAYRASQGQALQRPQGFAFGAHNNGDQADRGFVAQRAQNHDWMRGAPNSGAMAYHQQNIAPQYAQNDHRHGEHGDGQGHVNFGQNGHQNDDYHDNHGGDNHQWDHRRDSNEHRDHGGEAGQHWQHDGERWDREWRHDDRYDWQGYRQYNGNAFHIGFYYNPFGYNYSYQNFDIGGYVEPAFYAPRYWINDPYAYRLPPAYDDTRWVRYYNDVLLVDLNTGEVIDVIRNFFW